MELLSNINKIAFFLAVKKNYRLVLWCHFVPANIVISLISWMFRHLLCSYLQTDDTSCMWAALQVGWQMSPQALRASCLGQA